MAQPFLDLLHGHALLEQQAGAGVPQIVEPNLPQAVVGQQLGEAVGHRVGQNEIAHLVHKQVAFVLLVVAVTAQLFVVGLLLFQRPHPLAGKTRLTVQDLHGERLMMIRRGWNGAMDALRDDLAQKHPEIEIVDFDFFNLDTFNRCENANDLMVAIDNWKSVHPLLKVVPVRWKFTIPFGILHAPAPSPTVERFLEAIRQVTGAGEELPGGR